MSGVFYQPAKLHPVAPRKPKPEPKHAGPVAKAIGWTVWVLILAIVACFFWPVAVVLMLASCIAFAPCDCCYCKSQRENQ